MGGGSVPAARCRAGKLAPGPGAVRELRHGGRASLRRTLPRPAGSPGPSCPASATGSPGTSQTSPCTSRRSGRRSRDGWAPASPVIYRELLNAFYAAVKHVSSSNFVVTAGTAPYGDAPGGQRMRPVAFDRALFCLRDDARLTPLSCPDPPHLDALSHHPYGIGGPLWHALNADDAAVPDVSKIARVLHAAERVGHVRARRTAAAVGDRDLVGQLAAGPRRRSDRRAGALAGAGPVRSVATGRGHCALAADRRLAAHPQLREHLSGGPVLPGRRLPSRRPRRSASRSSPGA